MIELLRNFHHASRSLARTPVFAATIVLTIALTIGANSTVYSIIDRVLLRPLPFADADRLTYISHDSETSSLLVSIPPGRLLDWAERNSSFEAISAYYTESFTDNTGAQPERVRGATVGDDFLEVWGIQPALGRRFTDEEHALGGPTAVLVSDRYWRTHLNSDPGAVGESLILEGSPRTIVGVMPPEFGFVNAEVDIWAPLALDAPWVDQRATGWFGGVIGRMRAGVTQDQAELDLRSVQAALAGEFPETDRDLTVSVIPYRDTVIAPFRGSMWLLFGAVFVLLLIACANIAALVIARTAQRERDIGIRYSLGASRLRAAIYLSTETLLLVAAGTVGGLLAAQTAVSMLGAYTSDLPTFGGIELDARVFAYTTVCTIVVALLCGLVPAVRAARSERALSYSGRTQVSSRQTLNWSLIGIQVTLSVTLLTGAGLLLRSFDSLARVDLGFEADSVLTFTIHGNFSETNDYAALLQRINLTIDEVEALPGIESAATSFTPPGVTFSAQQTYELSDFAPPGDIPIIAENRIVSPSYFETLRIPLLSGTLCRNPTTPTASPREAMVNRAFADRYLGTNPAIGRQVTGGDLPARIVGVVGNAREVGAHIEAPPTVYTCYSASGPIPVFFARTTGDPMQVVESVRARLAELEPTRPVYNFSPLDRQISDVYAQDLLRTMLLTFFSATALSLVCLGIYGTLSHALSLRRREVGLRVALGALRGTIVMHYLKRAMKVVGIASAVGLGLSLMVSRFLSSMLYGISPYDPVTLAGVIVVVLVVATVAGVLPAVRASRIHPVTALREE